MTHLLLKVVGSIIVVSASTLAGFYFSNLESYRIEDLLEMKKALTMLKSEIEFTHTPLPQALHNISLRVRKPIGSIFFFIGQGLEERSERLSLVWESGFKKYISETFLKPEDMESFIGLGTTLGYLDGKMQAAGINLIIQYIETQVDKLNGISAGNKKMYRSMGLLCGLLTVIVLI